MMLSQCSVGLFSNQQHNSGEYVIPRKCKNQFLAADVP